MDALMARYFDGELGEREAREFLNRVEADPALERELRAYERLLAVGKSLTPPKAPDGFTERVMRRVSAEDRPVFRNEKRVTFTARWAVAAAAAAIAILAYAGGWWTGHSRDVGPLSVLDTSQAPQGPGAVGTVLTGGSAVLPNQTAPAEDGYQYVRLAYVPTAPDVERVTVAGSFNGWNPNVTPLRRRNGAWSTILVLPPGSYEYMFVEDGERWVTDPLAAETRRDGFGGMNAVIDVEL